MTTTLMAAATAVSLAGCASSTKAGKTAATPAAGGGAAMVGSAPGIAAVPGYQVAVFAKSTSSYSNPDSIVVDSGKLYIGFQNVTAKDGADKKSSTIVEYDTTGHALKTYEVPGHNDGLRVDPTSHLVWAMSNEDGNPQLTTIDPVSGAEKRYTFARTPHGGGYDDIIFMGGKAYLSASNPTIKNNTNPAPAVVSATLGAGTVTTTTVLMGNAKAKDANSASDVTISAVDPDSMFINPSGDLTLDNQSGTALISIHHPGPRQTVTSVTVGTQIDDTVYPGGATGRLLVADTKANTIYAVSGALSPSAPLVATPDDSTVHGFVGKLETSGNIVPIIVGFKSPHGMAYLPGP